MPEVPGERDRRECARDTCVLADTAGSSGMYEVLLKESLVRGINIMRSSVPLAQYACQEIAF